MWFFNTLNPEAANSTRDSRSLNGWLMGTTIMKSGAATAQSPSARHARHAGLIPGVPLKEQLGRRKPIALNKPATLDGGTLDAVPAPLQVPPTGISTEAVKREPARSAGGLTEKQKRRLKRKEKKQKRRERLEASLIGTVARTEKAKLQCRFCLLWFPQPALIMHLPSCKGSAPKRQVKCAICSASFPALEIYSHFEACERKGIPRSRQSPGTATKSRSIRPGGERERREADFKSIPAGEFADAVHTVPFEILPPGRREIEVLIARLKRRSRNHRHAHIEKQYYWERFDHLLSLGPVDHWEGKMAWRGYIAFVFPLTDTVILECARIGNATYLLNGRWQEMICATKTELRSEYRHESRRIFHTQGWESSIRRVVSGR
jgi:hypothetical protein